MAFRRTLDYFKKILLGLGIVLSLYYVLGAVVFPLLLKHKLPDIIQQETGRTALVSDVKFQPFQLVFNLQGLKILEPNEQISFAEQKQ